jgi:hypothetical protein
MNTESQPFSVGQICYYEIPQFPRYAISITGDVLNKRSMTLLTPWINVEGYHLYTLVRDDGSILLRSRHRLLCIVFKHPNCDFSKLYVNHINGIKGDDRLENLEWVTSQGNVEHAGSLGFSPKCTPIEVRNVDTGIVETFPSIIKYARKYGMSKDSVSYRVKAGMQRVFPERKQYRIRNELESWYIPTETEINLMLYGRSRPIQMRNVFTNEVLHFEKLSDLADHLKLSLAAAYTWVERPNQPVLPGYIQLKWATDTTPWREVTDPYLEYDRATCKRTVKVVDTKTGEVKIFPVAADCARVMGISTTALNYRLSTKGKSVFSDGCTYEYYS